MVCIKDPSFKNMMMKNVKTKKYIKIGTAALLAGWFVYIFYTSIFIYWISCLLRNIHLLRPILDLNKVFIYYILCYFDFFGLGKLLIKILILTLYVGYLLDITKQIFFNPKKIFFFKSIFKIKYIKKIIYKRLTHICII